jgi:hypothetical protein
MKYSEAYEFLYSDFEKKTNLHKKYANGIEMYDTKRWSNTPKDIAHKNYFESVTIWAEFIDAIYSNGYVLKIDPNDELPEYWQKKVDAVMSTDKI